MRINRLKSSKWIIKNYAKVHTNNFFFFLQKCLQNLQKKVFGVSSDFLTLSRP